VLSIKPGFIFLSLLNTVVAAILLLLLSECGLDLLPPHPLKLRVVTDKRALEEELGRAYYAGMLLESLLNRPVPWLAKTIEVVQVVSYA